MSKKQIEIYKEQVFIVAKDDEGQLFYLVRCQHCKKFYRRYGEKTFPSSFIYEHHALDRERYINGDFR